MNWSDARRIPQKPPRVFWLRLEIDPEIPQPGTYVSVLAEQVAKGIHVRHVNQMRNETLMSLIEDAIRAEVAEADDAEDTNNGAQAAEAPGQALDGSSSADVPSAERGTGTQSGGQDAIDVPLLEAPKEEKIEIGKISDKELRKILADMIVSMDEGTETADAIDTAVKEIDHRAGVIDLQETYEPNPETDQNLTRLLAVLLYAAPDPDWDRDDISNFADVVFTTANSTREKFIDIGTLCELMMESEYIATEMKSDATTHGILERLEKQEGEHAKHKPEKADARRQIAQALAALIYWVPRNLNNKKTAGLHSNGVHLSLEMHGEISGGIDSCARDRQFAEPYCHRSRQRLQTIGYLQLHRTGNHRMLGGSDPRIRERGNPGIPVRYGGRGGAETRRRTGGRKPEVIP